MSSSAEALSFFKEWLNSKTNLSVTAVLEGVVVSGVGRIVSLDEQLFLANPASRFSLLVPLEGSKFEASDPERGCGLSVLDEAVRDIGFKFGWEIVLPSKDRILLAEIEGLETSA